jgi:hypothetical protein
MHLDVYRRPEKRVAIVFRLEGGRVGGIGSKHESDYTMSNPKKTVKVKL